MGNQLWEGEPVAIKDSFKNGSLRIYKTMNFSHYVTEKGVCFSQLALISLANLKIVEKP